MKTIWKYDLCITYYQEILMQKDAVIIDIQNQNDILTMWAKVDTSAAKEYRKFSVYGTGHQINNEDRLYYIKSVQMPPFVWHVFEIHEIKYPTIHM